MLIDEAEIVVEGGHGGAGKVSFFARKAGPSGGNGGHGGDVYARVNTNVPSLKKYVEQLTFHAPDGQPGGINRQHGQNGAHLYLQVPVGTIMTDLDTGDEIELLKENDEVLIASGGEGGLGNDEFKTSTFQTPRRATPGKEGRRRRLKLILKLIAEYGLIGLPNAGKSSLLNELTAANVKTANYPFTTLEPNLGVYDGHIIADIPGLIEGASQGKGLGIKFLKHIEKVNLIFHCISVESQDIKKDYETVIHELAKYNPQLIAKKSIILLTKTDLASKEEITKKTKTLKKLNPSVMPISIHDYDSLELLKKSF